GRQLVIVGGRSMRLWSADTGSKELWKSEFSVHAWGVGVSPDGRHVFAALGPCEPGLVWALPSGKVVTETAEGRPIAFSPSSDKVFWLRARKAEVIPRNLATGRDGPPVLKPQGERTEVALGADGRVAAVVPSSPALLRVYDLEQGRFL